MKKWISVIIPHYNSVDLLEKLLNSIPKSPEIEIIVVDDKSNENIDKIKIIEEQVKCEGNCFLRNTTDKKGAGVCRNLALEVATGEWVMFADADDYFVAGAFEVIKNACALGKDLVYFAPTSIYMDSGEPADRHEQYERWLINFMKQPSLKNELFMRYKFLIPVCKLIKREAIGSIRFDEVTVSNDVMFSTKLAASVKEFAVRKDVIYCITKSAGTLVTKKSKENLETRVEVFVDRYKFLKNHLTQEEFDMLSLSGKSYLAKAFLDGYGVSEVFKILNVYMKNGVKIFSVRALAQDVRDLAIMMKVNKKDKASGI